MLRARGVGVKVTRDSTAPQACGSQDEREVD